MAKTTKTTVAKTNAKEAVKTEAVKTEAVKAEPVKAAPVKTEEVKPAAAKKPVEKKAAPKKAESKAPSKKDELYVQFAGLEFSYDELLEKVKADYIAQTGKKTITSTRLYLKPEEKMVYYVVNEKSMGGVFLG